MAQDTSKIAGHIESENPVDLFFQLEKLGLRSVWFNYYDQLRIRSWSSEATPVTLSISIRFVALNGDIIDHRKFVTLGSTRAQANTNYALGMGYLLSVFISQNGGSAKRGQTYVQGLLFNNKESFSSAVLFGDYVGASIPTGWPGGRSVASVEGPGVIRSIAGTNPDAGSEIAESVPSNARWRLLGIQASLVSSADVATRQVHFIIDDGTTEKLRFSAQTTQIASLTRAYKAAHYGDQPAAIGTSIFVNVPFEVLMMTAWRIITSTDNFQAADDWAAPQLMVEEWIEQ